MGARILIVDDHSLIAQGLKHIATSMHEIEHVFTAANGEEALKTMDEHDDIDLFIVDMQLPDIDGYKLIEEILKRDEKARILVNTMHDEVWTIKRLSHCGIKGAVLKTSNPSELRIAIQLILSGRKYFCQSFRRIIEETTIKHHSPQMLTPREKEVLTKLAYGQNTKEIAEDLGLSTNTVETHRKSLLAKLEAKNSIDMILKAVRYGDYDLLVAEEDE